MNWIFDTYSNVYTTAMMIEPKAVHHVAAPRKAKTFAAIAKLFHRG